MKGVIRLTSKKRTEIKIAKLHPDQIEQYEQLHTNMPAEMDQVLRERFTLIRLFRVGTDLVMIQDIDPGLEKKDRTFDEAIVSEWNRLVGNWRDVTEIYTLTAE